MSTPSAAVGQEPAYEPKLIYYSDRDEFEFVTKDVATICRDLLPTDGAAIICDMTSRDPVGFRIAGSMVRAAFARRPLNAVAEYGEPVAWRYTTHDIDGESWPWTYTDRQPSSDRYPEIEPLYSAATVSTLVAELDELVQALRDIAKQKLSREVDEYIGCDFEGGYDACIERARAALQSQEQRNG